MNKNKHCEDDKCIGKYNYKEDFRTIAETKRDVEWLDHTSELFAPLEIEWPTCGSINIQNSQENVEKLMNKWKSVPGLEDWMYNVEFIALKADQSNDYFLYEVKWSIPTPEYPIPQVTASVLFSIEASRVKSKLDPVDVRDQLIEMNWGDLVFENSRFWHEMNSF